VEDADELENVWGQLFATGFIAKLPALPKRILTEVRAASAQLPSTVEDCMGRFGSFNQAGYAMAIGLIAQHPERTALLRNVGDAATGNIRVTLACEDLAR
jgi:hypothetical protein